MKFKEAVEKTLHLEKSYVAGLQALRAEDRPHINAEDTRKLTGSVDVDAALRAADPHGHRWDFAIAYQHKNRKEETIYWVELHTASDSQVSVVIKKAQWLSSWLKGGGAPLAKFERDIVWLSSGSTTFTLSAPQKKQMAQVGLQHHGLRLRITNERDDY